MYRISLILIIVIFVSCSKNNQNSTPPEIEAKNDNIIFVKIDTENNIENIEPLTSEINFPKIMYVTAKEGLRKRSEPSLNGDVTGLLLYGERIIIYEKSDIITTIDNITDYWYRVWYQVNINEWVFGGYISENLPSDLPIILGKWDNINNEREGINFTPNYGYFHSLRKETSNMIWGNWEINENIIKIFNLKTGQDFMGIINDPDNIQLQIINSNNIILTFSDNKVLELRRSNDLW
jgi:hypothetical protein